MVLFLNRIVLLLSAVCTLALLNVPAVAANTSPQILATATIPDLPHNLTIGQSSIKAPEQGVNSVARIPSLTSWTIPQVRQKAAPVITHAKKPVTHRVAHKQIAQAKHAQTKHPIMHKHVAKTKPTPTKHAIVHKHVAKAKPTVRVQHLAKPNHPFAAHAQIAAIDMAAIPTVPQQSKAFVPSIHQPKAATSPIAPVKAHKAIVHHAKPKPSTTNIAAVKAHKTVSHHAKPKPHTLAKTNHHDAFVPSITQATSQHKAYVPPMHKLSKANQTHIPTIAAPKVAKNADAHIPAIPSPSAQTSKTKVTPSKPTLATSKPSRTNKTPTLTKAKSALPLAKPTKSVKPAKPPKTPNKVAQKAKPKAAAYQIKLAKAINNALSSNPEVLAERANWLRSQALVKQARGGYLPSIDLSYGYGRERSNTPSLRQQDIKKITLTRRTSNLTVKQLLFDGGNTRNRIENAQKNVLISKYRFATVRQTIVLGTIQAYVDILRFRELEQLANKNINTHKTALAKVKKRFKAGAGRSSDVELATARLALARATLQNIIDAKNAATYTFIRLTGLQPSTMQPIDVPYARLPKTLKDAEDLGLSKNPSLHEAQAQVEAANSNIKVAKTAFYPRFDLNLSSSYNKDIGGTLGANDSNRVSVDMTYNLFRGGADMAATSAARQQHINSKKLLANTERTVLENIRTAWSAYQIIKARIPNLTIHLNAMQNTADNYREQFKLGQRSLLDELNADTEVFNAQNNVVDAKYQMIINAYSLLFETGQLATK